MLRLLILSAPRPAVYSFDPAIAKPPEPDPLSPEHAAAKAARDAFDAAWKRYLDSYDLEELRPYFRDGREPVVFMIGQFTTAQVAYFEGLATPGKRVLERIAYGVHEIRNLEVVDERGAPVPGFSLERVSTPHGPRLSDAVMALFADDLLRAEVLAHVLRVQSSLPLEARKSN